MRFEAELSQFLLDPNIRSRVKPALEPWMFETEVYRAFAMSICNDQFDISDIDINVLRATIKSNYPSLRQPDLDEIERLIDDFNEVNESDLVFVLNMIGEHLKNKTFAKGVQCIAEDDPAKADEYITRAINLSLTQREATKLSDAKKLNDLLERKFPKDGRYIKSSFGLINENSTFKGYRRGDLVQVVAPTGRGKSSMMCQESATFAHQGFKIGYAIIGDNEEDDIAIKICAYYSKMPINEIVDDLTSYITEYNNHLDNISCITYPMYSVTVKELLSDFKEIKNQFGLDVLFVDYDQNISAAHDSMYESGGLIYGALKAFAQVEDCVVIVASQPKVHAWDTEIIGVADANESSKKQANVDMMITFNWNSECQKIGTMHIAKIRRGNTNAISRIKFNHHISELKEITQEDYDTIMSRHKARDEGCDLEMTDKELHFED